MRFFLLPLVTAVADVTPSLLSAQWRPRITGVCKDEACCVEQCITNGYALVNRTASGRLGCIGACLMSAAGVSEENIHSSCHEMTFLDLAPASTQACKKADPSEANILNECLAGALLGMGPLEKLENSDPMGGPEQITPNSFFWEMDAGPSMEGRGFSWYTRIFGLFQEGHPLDNQMGMGGTWLKAEGLHYDVCPCKPGGFGSKCCNTQDCDCAGWLFESFEGGPGYWGNELPTTVSKWRVGDSVGCYSFYTGSPLFQFGQYDGHDCSHMGIAQLSNQMLMLPDGITFEVEGMVGVGYMHTPFGKISDNDSRNFWTVVLDAENFAGPLAYFLPEFWKLRQPGYEKETEHFGDYSTCPRISQGQVSFEWNTLRNFKQNGVYKLPKMSIPYKNGRSVLLMNNRVFDGDVEIKDPIEKALKTGHLNTSTIMPLGSGQARECKKAQNSAQYGLEGTTKVSVGTTSTTIEDGECVWSVKLDETPGTTKGCNDNGDCWFPQYVNSNSKPIPESAAPQQLRSQEFPTKKSSSKYDQVTSRGRTCLTHPGPASEVLFCAQTLKGGTSATWVGYKWYKFVDQPGLQQAHLTESEKSFLQQRVETMHKVVTRTSRWIKAKQSVLDQGRAVVDSAALVTPPKGMEYGYVPIALYEGFEKHPDCHTGSSPAPTPPGPTPQFV